MSLPLLNYWYSFLEILSFLISDIFFSVRLQFLCENLLTSSFIYLTNWFEFWWRSRSFSYPLWYVTDVQSPSRVQLFATTWITAGGAWLSLTISQSFPKFINVEAFHLFDFLSIPHSPRLFHPDSLLMIQKLISPARPHSLFSMVHRTSLCWCSKDSIYWFAISCKSKMCKIFILAYAILESMK